MPITTKTRQSTTLKIIFPPAAKYFLLSINNIVSKLNDEKVLNPPSMPEIRKTLVLSESIDVLRSKPIINPITNAAITFDIKVPNGNIGNTEVIPFVIKYLAMHPKNPPRPTNNIFIMLILSGNTAPFSAQISLLPIIRNILSQILFFVLTGDKICYMVS